MYSILFAITAGISVGWGLPIRAQATLTALARPSSTHGRHAGDGGVSPRGTFKIVHEKTPGGEHDDKRIVLVAKTKRQALPPQDVWVDFPWSGDRGAKLERSDHHAIPGECYFSPNERWLCVVQKLYSGCSVAHLYERRNGSTFRPFGSVQFDLAAWDYYARRRGARAKHVPTEDPAIHLFDLVRWTADSRYLVFRLRPIKGYSEKQRWGWVGHYDTQSRRFGPSDPFEGPAYRRPGSSRSDLPSGLKEYDYLHVASTGHTTFILDKGREIPIGFSARSDKRALDSLMALDWGVSSQNADGKRILVIGELEADPVPIAYNSRSAYPKGFQYYLFTLRHWYIKRPFKERISGAGKDPLDQFENSTIIEQSRLQRRHFRRTPTFNPRSKGFDPRRHESPPSPAKYGPITGDPAPKE
jgi:hypothetical protein